MVAQGLVAKGLAMVVETNVKEGVKGVVIEVQ